MFNAGYLVKHIENLIDRFENEKVIFLDNYLSSLLSLVYKSKDKIPTYELFGEILENSFYETPLNYNSEWDQYVYPPFENYEPDPDDFENLLINRETGDKVEKFEVLEKTIIFQIALLKRIDCSINNEASFAQKEEFSNEIEWENFNIINYLKGATAMFMDYSETECDWLTLSDMLEYGRTYDIN